QRQRAKNAAQDLQETYSDFATRDTEEVEQAVARKMTSGADVLSARDRVIRDAAEDDTFTWPIEELDVESQHRVSVESDIKKLYDPDDDGQHQAGILKDTDGPQTKENHLKFTWFKNSGIDGKVSNHVSEQPVPEKDTD